MIAQWHTIQNRWDDNPLLRRGGLLLLVVLAFLLPLFMGQVGIGDAAFAEVYILLALGLNIVVGFAGLLDLGYAAFFAIGAYTAALFASSHFGVGHHTYSNVLFSFGPGGIHLNFFLLIPTAAVVAA